MIRMAHALAGCLLTVCATASFAEDAPGQRTKAEIRAMSAPQIQDAVLKNTAIMQLYYEELRRRNPGKMPPLNETIPGLKIDPAELAGLTDDKLMFVFEALSAENDRLIARGEKLLGTKGAAAPAVATPASPPKAATTDAGANTPLPSGTRGSPVPGVYQCYFATYTRWTASDYGDAPIAKLTLSPGNRFTYANSGGTYALGTDNELTFNGLKASYYTGARLVEDGTRTAIQLQFGQYGVQNCVSK